MEIQIKSMHIQKIQKYFHVILKYIFLKSSIFVLQKKKFLLSYLQYANKYTHTHTQYSIAFCLFCNLILENSHTLVLYIQINFQNVQSAKINMKIYRPMYESVGVCQHRIYTYKIVENSTIACFLCALLYHIKLHHHI